MSDQEILHESLDKVSYDLDTVKAMLQTKCFIYAIFMCQQSLEKCFKALLSRYKEDLDQLTRGITVSMVEDFLGAKSLLGSMLWGLG